MSSTQEVAQEVRKAADWLVVRRLPGLKSRFQRCDVKSWSRADVRGGVPRGRKKVNNSIKKHQQPFSQAADFINQSSLFRMKRN